MQTGTKEAEAAAVDARRAANYFCNLIMGHESGGAQDSWASSCSSGGGSAGSVAANATTTAAAAGMDNVSEGHARTAEIGAAAAQGAKAAAKEMAKLKRENKKLKTKYDRADQQATSAAAAAAAAAVATSVAAAATTKTVAAARNAAKEAKKEMMKTIEKLRRENEKLLSKNAQAVVTANEFRQENRDLKSRAIDASSEIVKAEAALQEVQGSVDKLEIENERIGLAHEDKVKMSADQAAKVTTAEAELRGMRRELAQTRHLLEESNRNAARGAEKAQNAADANRALQIAIQTKDSTIVRLMAESSERDGLKEQVAVLRQKASKVDAMQSDIGKEKAAHRATLQELTDLEEEHRIILDEALNANDACTQAERQTHTLAKESVFLRDGYSKMEEAYNGSMLQTKRVKMNIGKITRSIARGGGARGGGARGGGARGGGAAKSAKHVGDHSDQCMICDDGGQLLCCDSCPRACHLSCCGLKAIPKDVAWCCLVCRVTKPGSSSDASAVVGGAGAIFGAGASIDAGPRVPSWQKYANEKGVRILVTQRLYFKGLYEKLLASAGDSNAENISVPLATAPAAAVETHTEAESAAAVAEVTPATTSSN